MLAATRDEYADGMNYTRQRLARAHNTSEGADQYAYAPCREMQRTLINSGVVTTNTRPSMEDFPIGPSARTRPAL